MTIYSRTLAFVAAALLPLACTITPPDQAPSNHPQAIFEGYPGVWVPDANALGYDRLPWADSLELIADGPYYASMDRLPPAAEGPAPGWLMKDADVDRIESPIPEALADRLRADALNLPPSLSIHDGPLGPGLNGPTADVSFDSLDANDCCGGGLNVPPDPELAVGPNHIIAVVNVAFEIYDKAGNLLQGPTTFASFFSSVPGCTGVFDPNAIYDEEHDRFILGIDANGTDYCVAATSGSDPLGTWNQYIFATDVGGNFFDYPHAGVGLDAIYMGANMFASSFAEGRLWAMDKFAMYAGTAMSVVSRSTGGEGTPQPMNLHGWAQGTWPLGGPHYILTDGPFNGANYGVWSWDDPFGANVLTDTGTVNLNTATGVTAGFPIDVPQAGSAINLEANDWRVQDAEYRNGTIWMANTQACNPGGGTVDCIRWAQIDPTGPTVIEAGVYGTNGEYRFFADLAVDDCDNMAVGYTKSSASTWPGVWVAGRESTDTPGTLQAEQLLKAGERDYDSFQSGTSHRWGDYTGMTIDPDGVTFWYLGEYSKDITNFNTTTWGNYIGAFSFDSCDGGEPTDPPAPATNPSPVNGATNVNVDANLSWTAGAGATSHDVYFGTNPTPGAGEFQGNQSGTSFDPPGTLAFSTTYYWQIDEVNSVGTTAGSVWSFTTEDEPPPPPTMHLANMTAASEPANRNRWNAVVTVTVEDGVGVPLAGVTAEGSWSNGASGSASCVTNGSGQCEVRKNNLKQNVFSVTFTLTSLTLSGYDYVPADNLVPNVIEVFRDGNPTGPGKATNPSPADGATGVSIEADLSWTAGSGATSHDVYFGTSSPPAFQGNQGATTFDPGTMTYSTTYFWRIDESDGTDTTTGDLWSFTTEPDPNQQNGEIHVAALAGVGLPGNRGGRWNAEATITVEDEFGSPVAGVDVSGSWSNGTNGGGNCTTNGAGQCSITKNNLKNNVSSVTFTVDNLAAPGYDYVPAANTPNPPVVVISKP